MIKNIQIYSKLTVVFLIQILLMQGRFPAKHSIQAVFCWKATLWVSNCLRKHLATIIIVALKHWLLESECSIYQLNRPYHSLLVVI